MAATIMLHSADTVTIPKQQILRYAGIAGGEVPEGVDNLIKKYIPVFLESAKFRACYLEVPVQIDGDVVDFDCMKVKSHNLSALLNGCDRAILVAATVGIAVDMIIKRAEVMSKAEALILNSIAIAGIEQYMGMLNEFFASQYTGKALRPRYSPGYGDVPLEVQKDLLRILDTNRKIGVALSDSLLMTPSKSVSAFIGIGSEGCTNIDKDCDLCSKRECEYRLT